MELNIDHANKDLNRHPSIQKNNVDYRKPTKNLSNAALINLDDAGDLIMKLDPELYKFEFENVPLDIPQHPSVEESTNQEPKVVHLENLNVKNEKFIFENQPETLNASLARCNESLSDKGIPVKIETSEEINVSKQIHDNEFEDWKMKNEELDIKEDLKQNECVLTSQAECQRTRKRTFCKVFPLYDPICLLLETPFANWKDDDKRDFLNMERLSSTTKPFIEIEKQGKSKDKISVPRFRKQWYSHFNWLCGSVYLKKLFCLPCLSVGLNPSVWKKEGFNDFGNVARAFGRHEASAEHMHSVSSFANLKKNLTTIEDALEENSSLTSQAECQTTQKRTFCKMLPLYDPICILLETPFSRWENDDKRDFLNTERLSPTTKPYLEIEKQGSSKDRIFVRKFRKQWYSNFNWLCGSVYLQKLFCLPCLSVGVKSSVWNKEGFRNFGNVTRGCSRHEASSDHMHCALSFAKLKKNLTIIEDDWRENSRLCIKQFNDNVLLNRRFMELPIRATVYLGKQELALRGHNESSDNCGNFKELLDSYISISNIDIQEHYKKISSIFSANSKTIQNELIDCISDYIDEHIDREIKECNFFSIQVNDSYATDILQKSQCSLIIRYVSSAGKLVERFLGFFDVSNDRTADAVFNLVTKRIENYDYRSKLVGQSYDGASVMSEHVNDLQAKIKIDAPQAVFVHCAAHRFNLVLQQSCNTIPQCRIFFANVNSFSSFFHLYTTSTNVADTIIKKRITSSVRTSNANIVNDIYNEWDGLKQVFTEIKDDTNSDQSLIAQSVGFLNHLNNFEFALLIGIFSYIFEITDILFDTEKRSLDIKRCMSHIRNTQKLLNQKRNKKIFQKLFDLASMRADNRIGRKTSTAKEIFEKYQVVYYGILDTISGQIDSRFKDMDNVVFVALMDTSRFEEYLEDFPVESLNNLKNGFPIIFSDLSRLKNELSFIYNDENYRNIQLDRMLEMLYEDRDIFKEAWKLICLILTIPSTSVSVKHSFSCLKRIKTYLRNSVTENRFTNLAKMSIEKELLNELISVEPFYDDIIDKFAALKYRRIDLILKSRGEQSK